MNDLEKVLDEKVKFIQQTAETFVNKGLVGKEPFKLEKTLEYHLQIKNLLEKMEYNLHKDIPVEELLKSISHIEKEMTSIQDSER